MPTKFKPSQSTLQRGTKTVVTTHYYIKNISKEELLEEINKDTKQKTQSKGHKRVRTQRRKTSLDYKRQRLNRLSLKYLVNKGLDFKSFSIYNATNY